MTLAENRECPFCTREVLDSVFMESEHFMAIYNIAPILPGHSLIITRNHRVSFLDFDESEQKELGIFITKVIRRLMKVFNADAFNYSLQDGVEAGQTIPHFHLHVIPRRKNDFENPGDWYPKIENAANHLLDSSRREQLSKDQLKEILVHLRKED